MKFPIHRLFRLLVTITCISAVTMFGTGIYAIGQEEECPTPDKPASVRDRWYKDSYALVIGISKYDEWIDLDSVEADVERITKALKCKGFQVERANRTDRDGLLEQIRQFIRKRGGSSRFRDNRLLVYFTGHGYTIELKRQRLGFLVPKDAPDLSRAHKHDDFVWDAISFDDVISLAKRMKSKHALFVFDSCFSGALLDLIPPVDGGNDEEGQDVGWLLGRPALQFITSGSADEKVPDDGFFGRVFIQGITSSVADRDENGFVTASELGSYIGMRMREKQIKPTNPQYAHYQIHTWAPTPGEFMFYIPRGTTE